MNLHDALWLPERRALSAALAEANAITLRAAEAEAAVGVLDQVLAETGARPVVRIDVGRSALPSITVRELAHQTALILADGDDLLAIAPERRSSAQTRRLLTLRRELAPAFALLDGDEVDQPLVVSACLEALDTLAQQLGRPALLVLIGAERALIDKQLMQVLWELRATAQTLPRLTVLFCGGPGVSELTEGSKAAFYGWGQQITLAVDPKAVEEILGRRLSTVQNERDAAGSARWIAKFSGSSISVAQQLADQITLHVLEREPIDAPSAWDELARQHAPRLRVLAATTAASSVQSLPVATTIAHGRQPYTTDGTYDAAIRRALTVLTAIGVADRTGPRRWQIVDPFFAAWLRSGPDLYGTESAYGPRRSEGLTTSDEEDAPGFPRIVVERTVVVVDSDGRPIPGVTVARVAANGTYILDKTAANGKWTFNEHFGGAVTLMAAAESWSGTTQLLQPDDWNSEATLEMEAMPTGGSAIFEDGSGHLPGLDGRLTPIRDTHNRTYIYGKNLSFRDRPDQPASFDLDSTFTAEDADGVRMQLTVLGIIGRTSLFRYTRI